MENCLTVDSKFLSLIKKVYPVQTFSESAIVYEGHVPNACFIVIEGDVFLTIKKSKKLLLQKGKMIGFKELIEQKECKFTVQVANKAQLCVVDKTSILEHLKNAKTKKVNDLDHYFLELIK